MNNLFEIQGFKKRNYSFTILLGLDKREIFTSSGIIRNSY
jgi:hypothetical protein